MTTVAAPAFKNLGARWDAQMDYRSATLSGIVPDVAHLKRGGSHVSVQDLKRYGNFPDFSSNRGADRFPPAPSSYAVYSAAIDMSMNPADMRRCWLRVEKVFYDRSDPRRKYFAAFNGWNGTGQAERLDFRTNERYIASADHKWHSHLEIWREYVNSNAMVEAVTSVLSGETKVGYQSRYGGGSASPTPHVPQVLKKEVDEGMRLVRVKDERVVWLTDGFRRRWVQNPNIKRALAVQFGLAEVEMEVGSRADLEMFAGPVDPTTPVPAEYQAK